MEIEQKERERIEKSAYRHRRTIQDKEAERIGGMNECIMLDAMKHESTFKVGAFAEHLHLQKEVIQPMQSVMIAAAEEIQRCWPAHCDDEGYGPTNLMHRLEKGIPSQYGYTAGAFAKLEAENKALREGTVEFLTWLKNSQKLSVEAMLAIDQLLTKNEG